VKHRRENFKLEVEEITAYLRLMNWPRSASAAIVVCLLTSIALGSRPKEQSFIIVDGPTVIAFFEAASKSDLKNSPDANESLTDFQLYAKSVQTPLSERRIKFYEVYTPSFRIKVGTRTSTFHTGKTGVGYYLIAPDKPPLVESGVMTDSDLLREVDEYFTEAKTSTP
jgi:hypothetical protein